MAGGAAVPPTVAHGAAARSSSARRCTTSTRDASTSRRAWGPTRGEVRQARALVERLTLAQLAGQVVVAGYRGTGSPARLVRRLHLGGVVPVAENITSSGQIRAVNACGAAGGPRSRLPRVHRRRPGGRHGRAGARRGDPLPGVHVCGCGARPRADPPRGGRRRQGDARPGVHLGAGPGGRRDARAGRPGDRHPLGRRASRCWPPSRSSPPSSGIADAGMIGTLKHFPGPRLGHRRQPPRAARCCGRRSPSCGVRTWCRSAAGSRPAPRPSWSATSTCARSTPACRRRSRARWSTGCCAASSASAAWC